MHVEATRLDLACQPHHSPNSSAFALGWKIDNSRWSIQFGLIH